MPKKVAAELEIKPEQQQRDYTLNVSDISKKDLKSALSRIDPDCEYDMWYRIGLALHDWCPRRGLKLFDKWSKTSTQYDSKEIYDKWQDFEDNSRHEITVGTIFDYSRNDPSDIFAEEKVSLVLVKKKKRKKMKKGSDIFFDIEDHLTSKRVLMIVNQKSMFETLIVKGMHCVLFGASGVGKTTTVGWIVSKILKQNDEERVIFYSMDTTPQHNVAMFQYYNDMGLDETRVKLRYNATGSQCLEELEYFVDNDANLNNVTIIVDTLKYISSDMNNKKANKEAMHLIKSIQKLGATVISLAHTNKDGDKNSGTAEIEQDGDALIKMTRRVEDGTNYVSFTATGRVRYHFEPMTLVYDPKGKGIDYLRSSLDTMRVASEFDTAATVNEDKFTQKLEQAEINAMGKELKDKPYIISMKFVIDELNNDKVTQAWQSMVEVKCMESTGLGRNTVRRILTEYQQKHWRFDMIKRESDNRPMKRYETIHE